MQDRHDDRGATAVEYALMVSLIAGAIVATVIVFGSDVQSLYQAVLDAW